jgi:hypothetical protein
LISIIDSNARIEKNCFEFWNASSYWSLCDSIFRSTKRFGPDGERFEHLAVLNLAQNVVCLIWSYISKILILYIKLLIVPFLFFIISAIILFFWKFVLMSDTNSHFTIVRTNLNSVAWDYYIYKVKLFIFVINNV